MPDENRLDEVGSRIGLDDELTPLIEEEVGDALASELEEVADDESINEDAPDDDAGEGAEDDADEPRGGAADEVPIGS